MRILLIGSGGREHAMAWKITQSRECNELFIAPGNPGTSQCGTNVALDIMDNDGITTFCISENIDLVLVGPEVPLANGIVDALLKENIPAFGPSKAAAQLESSKPFSKIFMEKFNIPTAKFKTLSNAEEATAYLDNVSYNFVIKAGGLTAGKGVFLPESLKEARQIIDDIMISKRFGDAGAEIIIEERLEGPEISLMAFCDGKKAVAMIPVQDHKRLLDGQKGPNTGGMGAYAPVPFCSSSDIDLMMQTILQPAIDGMNESGTPYIGVLYAGLMLTKDGPKVLEFNCRFGDPETQVVLPLLESDLVEIAQKCISGNLKNTDVCWKNESAVTVVTASENYPNKIKTGIRIELPEKQTNNEIIFHAGTALSNGQLITSGGRVLNITGIGKDIPSAIEQAYQTIKQVNFEGMHFRTDIGKGAFINE